MKPHNTIQRLVDNRIVAVTIMLVSALLMSVVQISEALRIFLGIVYILFLSLSAGKRAVPTLHHEVQVLVGILLTMSYFAIFGTFFLYSSGLDRPTLLGMTILSPILIFFWKQKKEPIATPPFHSSVVKRSPATRLIRILYFVATMGLLASVYHYRTLDSIVTPWQVVPSYIFTLFFIDIILLIALVIYDVNFRWWYYVPLFFIAFGVVTILLPLGFGFDPFIHQATEKLIMSSGVVTPLPYMYVGYYSMVIWLVSIVGVPLAYADQFLSIIAASVMVPLGFVSGFRYVLRERRYIVLTPLLLLLLPYADFIQSTPQALSFVLLCIVVLLCMILMMTSEMPGWIVLVAATTTAALHPLTGLPAVVFAGYSILRRNSSLTAGVKRYLSYILFAGMVFVVPLALLVFGSISHELSASIIFDPAALTSLLHWNWYSVAKLDDILYIIPQFLYATIAVIIFRVYTKLSSSTRTLLQPFAVSSASILVSALLLSTCVKFNFITPGEQSSFTNRLLSAAGIILLPVVCYALYDFIKVIKSKSVFLVAVVVLLGAISSTTAWYFAYPRFDSHQHSKGYTFSRSDLRAVRWIHEDAAETKYIVLANQSVAGGAIREFGFAHYYGGMLYYPLPTNGPLYARYLSIMNEPDTYREALDTIKKNTGVNTVYLVVNRYWATSKEVLATLTPQASVSEVIDGGAVVVLKF